MIIGGTVFTAKAEGTATKKVLCVKCRRDFEYEVTRKAIGQTSAVYGIGAGWATRRAEAKADRKLQKLLQAGVDPVACPHCGWFQEEMVEEARRRRYTGLRRLGWIFLWVFTPLLALLVALLISTGTLMPVTVAGRWMLAILAGGSLLGLGLLVLVSMLRRRIDPNAGHSTRPPLTARLP